MESFTDRLMSNKALFEVPRFVSRRLLGHRFLVKFGIVGIAEIRDVCLVALLSLR